MDRHLAEGPDWLLGGNEPTFASDTLCPAIACSEFGLVKTPLDERFEHLERFWRALKAWLSFRAAPAADGGHLPDLATG